MLVGLDGTVGGAESLIGAIGALGGQRLSGMWKELNAPIPLGRHVNDQGVKKVGTAAAAAAGMMARASPLGNIPGVPLQQMAGKTADAVSRHALSAAMATLNQIRKVAGAAGSGTIRDIQNADDTVRAERALMRKAGFIHQLVRNVHGSNWYVDGPTTLGSECSEIIAREAGLIAARKAILQSEPLILAGYSRGGLNALEIARLLAGKDIGVDLLILLDPVDRNPDVPSEGVVPKNVKRLILIGRSGYLKYTHFTHEMNIFNLKVSIPDLRVDTQSRWWFGRLITKDDLAGFSKPMFHEVDCTHAAHGGLPWMGDHPAFLSEEADRRMAAAVAKTISIFLRMAGNSDARIRLGAPLALAM